MSITNSEPAVVVTMRFALRVLLLVGACAALKQNVWLVGTEYIYEISGKSLTALHQVSNQWTGVYIRANLSAMLRMPDVLSLKILEAEMSEFHGNLSNGFEFPAPDEYLKFKPLSLTAEPFEVLYKKGMISEMVVSKKVPDDEVNMLKAIASVLQFRLRGTGELPDEFYVAKEPTVEGKCFTSYSVIPLLEQDDLVQTLLLPRSQHASNSYLLDVSKARNMSDCEKYPIITNGIEFLENWLPAERNIGKPISQSSNSRLVLNVTTQQQTILMAKTVSKTILGPFFYEQQRGMLGSEMKLVLTSMIENSPKKPSPPTNPKSVGGLTYTEDWREDARAPLEKEVPFKFIAKVKLSDNLKDLAQGKDSSKQGSRNDPVDNIVILAKYIAIGLTLPETIPDYSVLSVFSSLTTWLEYLPTNDLKNISSQLYADFYDRPPKDFRMYLAWVVYVEALCQAGTLPALETLSDIILTGRLRDSEAVHAVRHIPRAAPRASEQYVRMFFSLTTEEVVKRQPRLLQAVLLASTELMNKALVHSHHHRHILGTSPDIWKIYIPALAQGLNIAMAEADSEAIQTYIVALGNIGYPDIFHVLDPYIDGRQYMSPFQRSSVILALSKMSARYPRDVIPVLLKLYKSTGEDMYTRSVAAAMMVYVRPSGNLLHLMSYLSKDDPSPQIINLVKSGLESLAAIKDPAHREIARAAQTAVNILNPKPVREDYSKMIHRTKFVEGLGLGYSLISTFLVGGDSSVPKASFAEILPIIGGYRVDPIEMEASVSSVRDLRRLLDTLFASSSKADASPRSRRSTPEWTPERVARLLNLQTDYVQQVEGRVGLQSALFKYFRAFSNDTLKLLPKSIKRIAADLEKGKAFNMTYLNSYGQIQIMFPNALGAPAFINFNPVELLYVQGDARVHTTPSLAQGQEKYVIRPAIIDADVRLNFTYSSRLQSTLIFVAFSRHYASSLIKDFQTHLPVSVNAKVDLNKGKVQFGAKLLDRSKKVNVVTMREFPYTTTSYVTNPGPGIEDENTKLIHVRPRRLYQRTIGETTTGFAFRVEHRTESEFSDLYSTLERLARHDGLSYLMFPFAKNVINYQNSSVFYDPELSVANGATIMVSYANAAPKLHVKNADDPSRRLASVGDGIKGARVVYMNLTLEFEQPRGGRFAFTSSYASSPVDTKSKLFWLSSYRRASTDVSKEVCLDVEASYPKIPAMNLKKVLETSLDASANVRLTSGRQCKGGVDISAKLDMKQSSRLADSLRVNPVILQCLVDMKLGSNILSSCLNASDLAMARDLYTLSATFKNVSTHLKNITYQVYSRTREAMYPFWTANVVNASAIADYLSARLWYSPNFDAVNISVAVPEVTFNFTNVREIGNKYVSSIKGVINVLKGTGPGRSCSLDSQVIRTFDNTTYLINLGKCWHVLLTSAEKRPIDQDRNTKYLEKNVTVMAIDHPKGKMLKVLVGRDVVDLSPGPEVVINGLRLEVPSGAVVEAHGEAGSLLLRTYKVVDELTMELVSAGLRLQYDGQRALIRGSESMRGAVRGLCGTFDTEPSTDGITPWNCVLQRPDHFAASFALVDDSCSGPAVDLHQQALKALCYSTSPLIAEGPYIPS